MAAVINTNIASLNTQINLNKTQQALSNSLTRLSSGYRFNPTADDAAGLKISRALRDQIKNIDATPRAANDGISLAQTADKALSDITEMLQRSRALASQQQDMQPDEDGYKGISEEMAALATQINDVAQNTRFNGQNLLDGSFQGTHISVYGVDVAFSAIGDLAALVGTKSGTLQNVDDIDKAIQTVSDIRSSIGASHHRLDSAYTTSGSLNTNTSTQTASSRNLHLEAESSIEAANLIRSQILQQAGTGMLSQANTRPQQVLALLRN